MKDNDNYMMLLNNAEKLIESSGLQSLSIRNLAKESNVSTGYLYNYFKNKDDLMDALMDNFYRKHLHNKICTLDHDLSFVEYIEQLLGILSESTYDETVLSQILLHHKEHFIDGLNIVYRNDKFINSYQGSDFNVDDFILFVTNHVLQNPKQNFQVLRVLLENTLYKEKKNEKND